MKKSFMATGSRLEPRIDQVVEWSLSKKDKLEIDDYGIRFGEWTIPREMVKDAVLNTERIVIAKRQSLLVDCGEGKYIFGLFDHIDNDLIFPFKVRVTHNRSYMGKLGLLAIAMFFLNVAWDIAQQYL